MKWKYWKTLPTAKKQDNEYCNLVLGFNSIKLPTEGWGWVRDSCVTTFLTNVCNNFEKYMLYTTWFGKSLSGKATLGLDLGLITLTKWLIRLKSIFRKAKTSLFSIHRLCPHESFTLLTLYALRKTMPSATEFPCKMIGKHLSSINQGS